MSTRASLGYFFTRALSGGLAVATVSIFARLLGPAGYGHWTLIATIAVLIAGVLIQPLHSSLARFLPTPGFADLPATLGRAMAVAGLIGVPVALLLEWLAPGWLPRGVALAALVLGLSQGVFDFTAQYLASTLRTRRYGSLYLGKSLLVLVAGWLVLRAGGGAWGLLGVFALAYLIASVLAGSAAWRAVIGGRFDIALLRSIRGYALPVAFSLFTGVLISWGDRLVLAAYVPPADLGAYAATGDLTLQGFGLLFSALYLSWFPRLVSAWEGGRDAAQILFSRYLQLFLLVLTPSAAGFILVAPTLAGVLLGAAYHERATQLMPWFVFTAFAGGVRMYLLELPLHLTRRLGLQSVVVAICAALALLLNLLLVPRYGVLAAAIVAGAVQALGGAACLWAGRGALSYRLPWRDVLGVACSVLAMVFAVRSVEGSSWSGLLLQVVTGAVTYAVAVLAFDVAGLRAGAGRLLVSFRQRRNQG
ncbi:polysaccharide biosynthesis C-terminal domain-containing protein [Niveibacterium sp. SC-1]|uniref:lipopolysaccharide biosynthesis protein n=1 Tax=Niveibacterium sp. SC-1 TaxID=3135646 RepID=UPI00311E6A88